MPGMLIGYPDRTRRVDSPEQAGQHGIRQARQRVMREPRAHERPCAREVPREVEQPVHGADSPAPTLGLRVVEDRLRDLDVCPNSQGLYRLGPFVNGFFDEDESLLQCLEGASMIISEEERGGHGWLHGLLSRGLERANTERLGKLIICEQ